MSQQILLYSFEHDIDIYAKLLVEAGLGSQLLVCKNLEDLQVNMPNADLIFSIHMPPEVYRLAEKVQWIQSMWAGVDKLIPAPIRPEVIITKPTKVFGQYLSQYVFGYYLASKIRLRQAMASQQEKVWKRYQLTPIYGTKIGIAGFGDIGIEIARVAKSFLMEVWSLNTKPKNHEHIDRAFGLEQIKEFVAGVDLLVIVLPNTAETKGLFTFEVLSSMKPDAMLINVGRGAVIDEEALVEILRQEKIAGAVLDVFVQEPLPTEHPFWSLANCVVTPHIGGPSLPIDITCCFLENYKRFVSGEQLIGVIDRSRGY
ncbi:MAG: D-2-hydroxyacid dehydrogenase [Blastocatellia bacterium]|nr:D-2-hydroxyacid dehydrogenase [Blastocatellia bacterium]